MRHPGRLAFALAAAGVAVAAPAAADSRDPAQAVPTDTPVQPDARTASPPAGAWTRDGWSDDARGTAARADAPSPADPRPADWAGAGADRGTRYSWRRQTWDGGRGEAYRYRLGSRLPRTFADPVYFVRDWAAYDLARPGPGLMWVRYYDDAVLVDSYGIVLAAAPAIGWDTPRRRPDIAYGGAGYPAPAQRPAGAAARGEGECHGGGREARTCVYRGADGGTTVVVTQPAVVTTTTTTRYVPVPARRTVAKPRARLARR